MAVDSSKLLERDIGISKGAHITAPQVKMLKVTKAKLGDVANNLKDNLVLTKVRNAAENKRRQEALRKKREAELENKKKKKGSKGGGIKIPGAGMLGGFINGLITVLWGVVVVKMLDLWKSPAFQNVLKIIGNVGKVILRVVGWLWEGFTTLVDWGYKLYDMGEEWIKGTFGDEAAEKFATFMDNLKSLINGFIAWKLVGEKIFKAMVRNVTWIFRRIKGIFNLAKDALKQGARFLNWMTGGRAGKLLKNLAGKGKGFLTKAGVGAKRFIGRGGRQLLKRGGSILKGAKSVAKRGLGRVLKRGALKVFGKTFVKTAGKIFGRVPIVGPLIVGLVSLVAGEPIGKALFKTFGAALGGFLGSIAGGAITAALAVASGGLGGFLAGLIVPASVMIGEILGTFVGDMLYGLLFEGGLSAVGKKLKKAFAAIGEKIVSGINFVKDFIEGGFTRFYEGIPKFTVPDFPEKPPGVMKHVPFSGKVWKGLKVALKVMLGPLSLLMGKEIPNILWLMNPLNSFSLLKNSFFPSDSSSPPATGEKTIPMGRPAERLPDLGGSTYKDEEIDETTLNKIKKAAKAGNDSAIAKSEGSSSKGLESYPSYDGGEGTETIVPVPVIPKASADSKAAFKAKIRERKGLPPIADNDPKLLLYAGK